MPKPRLTHRLILLTCGALLAASANASCLHYVVNESPVNWLLTFKTDKDGAGKGFVVDMTIPAKLPDGTRTITAFSFADEVQGTMTIQSISITEPGTNTPTKLMLAGREVRYPSGKCHPVVAPLADNQIDFYRTPADQAKYRRFAKAILNWKWGNNENGDIYFF